MSKGSKSRPFSVDRGTYSNNFDEVFGKKESKPLPVQHEHQWTARPHDWASQYCSLCGEPKIPKAEFEVTR